MTGLYLHQPGSAPYPVAVNYEPSDPPPVAILADWLKIAGVTNQTAAQLGAGWLKWHEE